MGDADVQVKAPPASPTPRITESISCSPTTLENRMKKVLAVLVASTFALGSAGVMAADPPKDKAAMMKLEKPAGVSAEAWTKMTDAEKQKAVDEAKMKSTAAAPKKKEKKGGC
jgi:hypothetical protein